MKAGVNAGMKARLPKRLHAQLQSLPMRSIPGGRLHGCSSPSPIDDVSAVHLLRLPLAVHNVSIKKNY